jgi:diguanylate cyclase (GGDEF)-like protein/PAS domain S-box-containing protein
MNLRLKTALIVGTASVTMAFLLSFVVSDIWRSEFNQLERNHMNDKLSALDMSLHGQFDQLKALNYDWSAWDSMYDYASNKKSTFLDDVDGTSLVATRLDLMLVLNTDQQTLFSRINDRNNNYTELEPLKLQELLAQLPTSLTADQEKVQWVRVADHTLLVTVRPILKNNAQGSPRGMVVVGRWLETTVRKALSASGSGQLQVLEANALTGNFNSKNTASQNTVSQNETDNQDRHIQAIDEQTISASLQIRDENQQALNWLGLSSDRQIHAQGNRVLNLLNLILVGAAVLFTTLITVGLELGILRRIANFGREIRAIRDPRSPDRLRVGRNDELGLLAQTFNATLEVISQTQQVADESQRILKKMTRKYEAFMRDGHDLVFLVNRDGDLQFASPNVSEVFGQAGLDVQNNRAHIFSLVHPEDLHIAENGLIQVLSQDGVSMRFEIRAVPGAGSHNNSHNNANSSTERWFEIWANNLEKDPDLKGLLLNIREVTQRKLNEAALLESERRLRLHFERMPLAVFEWDTNLRVSSWNAAAEEMFGYSAEEAIGKVMFEALSTGSENVTVTEILSELLSARGSRAIQTNRRKDGGQIVCEWTNTAITDQYGEVVSVTSVARDITKSVQSETEILESREQFRELVGALDGVVWEAVYGQQIVFMSDRATELLGYEPKVWFEVPDFWERHVHPDDLAQAEHGIEAGVRTGGSFQSNYRFRTSDGRYLWMRDFVTVTHETDGTIRLRGVMLDFSDTKQNELKLEQSEARYELAMRGANDGIWDMDILSNQWYASKRCREIVGLNLDETSPVNKEIIAALIHPDDLERYHSAFYQHIKGETPNISIEFRVHNSEGLYRWVLTRGVGNRDSSGRVTRLAGSVTDLSERSAYYDPLTGLPGRRLLVDRLERTVATYQRDPERSFALLFMDLNRFKIINDSLGHAVGDALLIEVARRIDRSLRPGDIVARWGGDEFVLLLENSNAKDAKKVAMRLRLLIGEPFKLGELETFTAVSIGMVSARNSEATASDYLRSADTAMYSAKALGTGIEEYDLAMHSEALERMDLETALCRAIEHNELCVYYQPIVDAQAGRIKGFEALVRWKHPKRGLVPPGDFIPLAEETGLIVQIGEWVLEESCRQLRAWRNAGVVDQSLSMNINVASLQLQRNGFVDTVAQTLERHQLEAGCINLEITESSVVQGSTHAEATLRELRQIGVGLHLDDFGTGYSSLSYLRQLPITTIKIDRTFIRDMGIDTNREIVRVIMSLANTLGLGLTCEGIETTQQLTWLREMGCTHMQGYLFSKPVPAHEALRLIDHLKLTLAEQNA